MPVSLKKHQKVSLSKENNSPLSQVTVGLGWDPVKKKKGLLSSMFGGASDPSIDLDASCAMLDRFGNLVDVVWFAKPKSNCGSISHGGDNRTGEGDGDDETISVSLASVPQNVQHLAFTVNSFRGQTFNEVENAFCRVVGSNEKELARYNLSEQGSHTGILIAAMTRSGSDWEFEAHGKACKGRMIEDMLPSIIAELVQ